MTMGSIRWILYNKIDHQMIYHIDIYRILDKNDQFTPSKTGIRAIETIIG